MVAEDKIDSALLDALTCPITLELFVDPVLAGDGHTYERSAIVEWLKNHSGTSPMTRQPLTVKQLKRNRTIKRLADQYRLSFPSEGLTEEPASFSGQGTLLNHEQQILLNQSFRKEKTWSLIYKATRDGFDATDFHLLCNDKGPTLTLLQTRSRLHLKKRTSIFGGYTTVPWSSKNGFYRDPQAFLFLMTQNKLTRFNLRSDEDIAVSHSVTSGPIFGLDDIRVCHQANKNNFSCSKFPYSYEDLEENGKGRRTFSNLRHFLVSEIEVYQVVM